MLFERIIDLSKATGVKNIYKFNQFALLSAYTVCLLFCVSDWKYGRMY